MAKDESKGRAASRPNMKMVDLIGDGENPHGFTAQTANGTAHWRGTGWNRDFDWVSPQVEPDATRPSGRSNRTGE